MNLITRPILFNGCNCDCR